MKGLQFVGLIFVLPVLVVSPVAEARPDDQKSIPPPVSEFPRTDLDVSANTRPVTDISAARAYINRIAREELGFGGQEAFVGSRESQLKTGHTFYRFQHSYRGIPVELNELI